MHLKVPRLFYTTYYTPSTPPPMRNVVYFAAGFPTRVHPERNMLHGLAYEIFFCRDLWEGIISHPCMDTFRHRPSQKNTIAGIFLPMFQYGEEPLSAHCAKGVVALGDMISGFELIFTNVAHC